MATSMKDAVPMYTPWPEPFVRRYRELGYWRGEPLGQIFRGAADRFGDRVALVAPGARLSYRELDRLTDGLGLRLLELGLERGDRVVLHLPTTTNFIVLYLALLKMGGIPVMALPPHRASEITYLASHTNAKAYAIPRTYRGFDYVELAREVQAHVSTVQRVLVDDPDPGTGNVSLPDLVSGSRLQPASDARSRLAAHTPASTDVAVLLLSGGTTGLPKLIPRTHDDYGCNSQLSAEVCGLDDETVYLVSLPISHNFPLASPGIQGTLMNGGRVVIPASPEARDIFSAIQDERVTITSVVPTMAIRWLDTPSRDRVNLRSLRVLQVGGARLNPEIAKRIEPELGCRLQQVFGMAEGLLNYTRLDDPDDVIVGTQGRPCSADDEILIVDPDGRPVGEGERGELLTRGPYTIRGYYRAEDHNVRSFTSDGFYRTGDVVRRTPDGNLIVEGRSKDMINRGGEKISAEEVENLILSHPHVSNVAVVAMPDPELGERSCAYVVLKPDKSLTLDALVRHLLAQSVAKFKLPERLEVIDSLPVSNVGKVSKETLRRDIADRMANERDDYQSTSRPR